MWTHRRADVVVRGCARQVRAAGKASRRVFVSIEWSSERTLAGAKRGARGRARVRARPSSDCSLSRASRGGRVAAGARGRASATASERENVGLSARSLVAPGFSLLFFFSFFFFFFFRFLSFARFFSRFTSLVARAPFFDTVDSIEFHLSSTLFRRPPSRAHAREFSIPQINT